MYNFIRALLMPFLYMYMLINKDKREFFNKRFKQNFDFLRKEEYIWVHCSSMGEVNLSEALIKKLLLERKERILLSVFTDTGMANAKQKYKENDRVDIIFFPLDKKDIIENIILKINLKLLILIETEIWPNLITQCSKVGKVIIVNGRISDKSFGKYRKFSSYLKPLFEKISGFYMQSPLDSERIIEIGADKNRVETLGNLKFDIELERFSAEVIEDMKQEICVGGRKIFTAGSTRSGENEIILDVFEKMKNTLLILVPRHLERIPQIEELIQKRNKSFLKYSEINSDNFQKTDIILVDKMGVLRKLYAIADITFVGGTLVNIGGHSLLEPLFYEKTPIFGKYLQNVKDISKEILKKDIGYKVESVEEFLKAIEDIEKTSGIKREKIREFFSENSKVAEKVLDKIDKLI